MIISCTGNSNQVENEMKQDALVESFETIPEPDYDTTYFESVGDSLKIKPKPYIDFSYDYVNAFCSADPMDMSLLTLWSDTFNFHASDTLNVRLNSDQIVELEKVLSGDRRALAAKSTDEMTTTVADCFYPRHNIIFVKKPDTIVNYISVCFECNRANTSKNSRESMNNLETYFNSIGLRVFKRPDYYSEFIDSLRSSRN